MLMPTRRWWKWNTGHYAKFWRLLYSVWTCLWKNCWPKNYLTPSRRSFKPRKLSSTIISNLNMSTLQIVDDSRWKSMKVRAWYLRLSSTNFWCHSGFEPPADLDPPFADLDPLTKLSFWASFVSYLVTSSTCKLFCRCSFQSQHKISLIKVKNKKQKTKKKPAISFQFYRIHYSEWYSICRN